jgi:phage gpG-like protein
VKEFNGMAAFAEHLLTLVVAEHEAVKKSLEEGAKVIEKRAKDKIGEYQEQAGPFIAWPELSESTKADRARQGYPEDEPLLRSGEMRDSIGHKVGEQEAVIGSNDDKTVWQELGTQHIPPRSFLGAAAAESAEKICEITGRNAVVALVGADVFGGKMLIED